MSGMRGFNRESDSQSVFSRKCSHSRILEIDTWMPSEMHSISPTVDRLMRLMEGAECVQEAQRDVEQALREALGNAVVHASQVDSRTKVHIRCRCGSGSEISVVVTHQGKGFDFGETIGNRPTIEVHNGDTALSSVSLKPM